MWKRVLAGICALTLFAAMPAPCVSAVEPNEQSVDAQKTPEELEAEAKAKYEAERKAALETPIESNARANWPQGPAVYAHAAVVMDVESGAILYAKCPNEKHFPASITKLLTTLVTLENAQLTDKVTFTQASVDFLNWDDAHIGMRPGEEINMKDALHAVLLASANEVSYAVAESTGVNRMHGGYETFIARMNTRAQELGCTGSHWVNPNGLHDENHYTTAHDMALIGAAVSQKPEFLEIMKDLEYRIPKTNLVDEERVFQQNHKMLWPENYYYYEYCTGGKTGYTDQSGTTLVTMADNGQMKLSAVVLQDYGVDAYTDTRAMLDYAFQNFQKRRIAEFESKDVCETLADPNAYVVLPSGVEPSALAKQVVKQADGAERLVYTYEGQDVGSAEIEATKEISFKEPSSTNGENASAQDASKAKADLEKALKKNQKLKKLGLVLCVVGTGIFVLFGIGLSCVYQKYLKRKRQKNRKRMPRSGKNVKEAKK